MSYSNKETYTTEAVENDSVQNKLKEIVTDTTNLGGFYDEATGGEMLINSNLNAVCEFKDLRNKTVYMRYRDFSLGIDAGSGDAQLEAISLNQNMPGLPPIQAVSDKAALEKEPEGWFIKGTNTKIADKNGSYADKMTIFTLAAYGSYINDGVIAIEPRFVRKAVKITFEGFTAKTYSYGKYVDFVPASPTAHQAFIGWATPIGDGFDGFAHEDITLNARWAYKIYKFEFVTDGGTSVNMDLNDFERKYLDSIISLPIMEKGGYNFVGWFASPEENAEQYCNDAGVFLQGKDILSDETYAITKSGTVRLYARYIKK
jgi:hypothetical protein